MIALMIIIANAVGKFLLIHVPRIHGVLPLICPIPFDFTLSFCCGWGTRKGNTRHERGKNILVLFSIVARMNGAISHTFLQLYQRIFKLLGQVTLTTLADADNQVDRI